MNAMPPRAPDAGQIGQFVDSLFRYADDGTYASLRAFDQFDRAVPPVLIWAAKIGGAAKPLHIIGAEAATQAEARAVSTVFAPPIATFTGPSNAKGESLANGLTISVDLDEAPAAGRARLEGILGPATVAVESGSIWTDPETGELQSKLHLHWRLSEPTRDAADHLRLRMVRGWAAEIVGADPTGTPINHPLRWPGTWNTKAEPRMARIVHVDAGRELHLTDAQDLLEGVVARLPRNTTGGASQGSSAAPEADAALVADALLRIPNGGDGVHYGDWIRFGYATWRATGGAGEGFEAWEAWSKKSDKFDAGETEAAWRRIGAAIGGSNPSRTIGAGTIFHAAKANGWRFPIQDDAGAEADAAIERQDQPRPASKGKKKPQRTEAQFRAAAAFRAGLLARRKGATFTEMRDAIAADPMGPGWLADMDAATSKRELQAIWDKADPAKGELILSGGSPLHSARQFLLRQHTLDGLRTLHHQNGAFYGWQRSHYVERQGEEMRALLYRFLDKAKRFDEDGNLVDFDPTKNKVANVLEATAAEAQLSGTIRPPAWLTASHDAPAAAEVIACANGLLHLPTGVLLPLTPQFFTLNALDFAYDAAAPEPAEWLTFLRTIWPNDQQSIDALQELCGLLLTADTRYQKMFLIVGPKRSGKGTIARVLTQLLGQANVCGPTLSGLGTNFGMAPLIGKRLAIISDARLSGKADQQVIVERLLSVSGEDGLTIDRKFRDGWTGKLDARFLFFTNELPKLTDSSGALAGRFIILRMVQSFYGREDLALGAKLAPEMPGILRWAIAGWKRLTARGYFVAPESSRAAQQQLEEMGSPIGAFLRDCCIVGQGHGVAVDELFGAWKDWCTEQHRDHAGTKLTFGRDLAAAIAGLEVSQPRTDEGRRYRFYEGVGLSADYILARTGTRATALCPPFYHDDPGPSFHDPH